MSRLAALVPGAVCAAALGRAWPEDLDGQVRCIDEGTRSLGLAHCCAPWSPEAEDAALRSELGLETEQAGTQQNLESLGSDEPKAGADFDGDAVAAALALVPGAPGVMGLVSGPLTWSIRAGSGAAIEDAVDAASDLVCDRLRELAERGVERIAVLESSADDPEHDGVDLIVEAHRPIVRSAAHLRIGVLLVATHSAANTAARLAYRQWVGPDHCSEGLAFLPATALASPQSATDCISHLASADTVVTGPLSADTGPDVVRLAARLLGGSW